MEYTIKTYGNPVLKNGTEKVSEFDSKLNEIVNNMIDTMYRDNGIGLAAPQVGISKKIVVVDPTFGEDENALLCIINPEITETGDECELEEGCLSVPGVFEFITRPEKIKVTYQDVEGNEHQLEADGLLARVIQHEIDHLEGILFIDRLSTVKRNLLAKTLRSIEEEGSEV
ncbi:peptide deformylase [Candidatus Latescibacterota bacterium]